MHAVHWVPQTSAASESVTYFAGCSSHMALLKCHKQFVCLVPLTHARPSEAESIRRGSSVASSNHSRQNIAPRITQIHPRSISVRCIIRPGGFASEWHQHVCSVVAAICLAHVGQSQWDACRRCGLILAVFLEAVSSLFIRLMVTTDSRWELGTSDEDPRWLQATAYLLSYLKGDFVFQTASDPQYRHLGLGLGAFRGQGFFTTEIYFCLQVHRMLRNLLMWYSMPVMFSSLQTLVHASVLY